MPAEHKTNFRV